MARINDYPEVQSLSNDDVFLIDPGDGDYKTIKTSTLANDVQSKALGSIYDACVAAGVTPASKSLSDILTAISLIGHGKTFNARLYLDANGIQFIPEWLTSNIVSIYRDTTGSLSTFEIGHYDRSNWIRLATIDRGDTILVDPSWLSISQNIRIVDKETGTSSWGDFVFTYN